MKQPIHEVMLPTEDASNIAINLSDGKFIYTPKTVKYPYQDIVQNQHIYITISQDVEPIKEGDWCIDVVSNYIYKAGLAPKINEWENQRKIIATTDPKLTKCSMCGMEDGEHKLSCKTPSLRTCIPQVSQTFLEEFVKNPNGKWEVECGKYCTNGYRYGNVILRI
jgi:hypothetical protein